MHVLWLRYLTEINESTRQVSEDLLENPEIRKAVTQIEESAFSDAQLLGYDSFWDAVRVENTLVNDAMRKGLAEGIEQGMKQGILQTARNMKDKGIPADIISQCTGLAPDIIKGL